MEKSKQYEALIEIMAQARLLAAFSDNNGVSDSTVHIKLHAKLSAEELGYSDAKFKSDSIVRYRELADKLK